MSKINKIKLSGTTYDVEDANASKTVELTQAQYDALVQAGTVDPNTFYIITDAQAVDLSEYWTSGQTQSAIDSAVSGKADYSAATVSMFGTETISSSQTAQSIVIIFPYTDGVYYISGGSSNMFSITSEFWIGYNDVDNNTWKSLSINNTGDTSAYTFTLTNDNFYFQTKGINRVRNLRIVLSESATVAFTYKRWADVEVAASTVIEETILPELSGKQDTLSAGTGIDITNNVISATGGGGGITSGEVQTMIDESVSGKADTSAVTESLATKVNVADNNVLAFSGVPLAINVNESYKSLQLKTIYIKNNDDTQHSNVVFGVIRYHYDSYDTSTNISGSSIPPSGITTITNTDTTAYTFTLENGVCRIDFLGSCYFSRLDSEGDGFSFYYIHNNNYTSGQSSTVIENTVYDALTELGKDIVDMNDSGRFVNVSKAQDITGNKTFIGSANTNNKPIVFKQSTHNHKIGFSCQNSASTEIATFEFRPNTYTDSSSVSHPLLYLGHYRNTNIANAGVVQTMVGFRQYDQSGGAAYHYLMPLPAEAKTPFSLTTSFKDYFAPLGFKNGSTMITTDNTGVADFSGVLGGLKLVKLTQTEYDNLSTKDSNTLYVIVN